MPNIKRANTSGITKSGVAIPDVPDAPTIGAATNVGTARAFNNGSATVAFTANPRGGTSTSFTATSTPGSFTATGAGSPLTVTGLQSNTAYTFAVTGTNASATGAASAASSSITATTVPATPSAPTGTNVGTSRAFNNGAVSVAFTAPATGGAAISSYTVTSSPGSFTGTGSSSPITVAGLASATAYTFTMTATNANGTTTASPASASVTATTVPAAPTIGGATAGNASATVAYTAGATGGAAVSTFTATSSPGGFTGTGASPITVSGLSNGTAYTFTVTATNANGTSTASAASNSVTPVVPPAAFFGGGFEATTGYTNIQKIPFGTETRSTISTSYVRGNSMGLANSGNAGYFMGADIVNQSYGTRIIKVAFTTDGVSLLGATLNGGGRFQGATFANSGTAGYDAGGFNGSSADSSVDKLTFSNDSVSLLAATLSRNIYEGAGFANSGTAGYVGRGRDVGAASVTSSDKFTFSNDTRATFAAGLTTGFRLQGAANSGTAGYWFSGLNGGGVAVLTGADKIAFSNDTVSTVSSVTRQWGSACAWVGNFAYIGGGSNDTGNNTNQILKYTFSNDTSSTASPTLLNVVYAPGAMANSSGTLQYMTMEIIPLPNVDEKYTPDVLLAIAEIQQARSNFQLQNFVVNQHDTEEMRYMQTLIELQQLYYTIKTVSLEMKKSEIEINRLRETGDEIDELDAQIKELGLEQTRLVGIGAFRELDTLMNVYNSFEHKYTRQEIESAQPEYWNKRLSRQATLEAIGGTQAQAAHLDSLRQIGALEMAPEGGIRAVSQEMQQMTGQTQKELL